MIIIDTHSHIYDEAFDEDIEIVIERAKKAGVCNILLPNVDIDSIERTSNLADRYKGYCLPMMGLHPCEVTINWESDLSTIKKQFSKHKYIAVGEIGIDLHWDKSTLEIQKAAFEEQLRWSIEYNLPVSIHCREAVMESIDCIKKVGSNKVRGVFHSFGGSAEELKEALALDNFYIGINGTVTYKNSSLPAILKNTTLSRLVVETDAPYLPPVPYRGKRNEPSYTTYMVEKLSDIYEVLPEEVANITTQNAKKLYNIQ